MGCRLRQGLPVHDAVDRLSMRGGRPEAARGLAAA